MDRAIQGRRRSTFPFGTLAVNVSGSLTGLLTYHGLSSRVLAVAGTGFCGGFTTWSTASWESVRLLIDHSWPRAAVYTLGGLAAALLAAAAGIALGAA
jgi:CrcB protein